MTIRVTKMVCPSCEGSGLFFNCKGTKCMWCRGVKRLTADEAAHYANSHYSLAIGGYIAGDHDLADARAMERKAESIFALLQRPVPWRKAA